MSRLLVAEADVEMKVASVEKTEPSKVRPSEPGVGQLIKLRMFHLLPSSLSF